VETIGSHALQLQSSMWLFCLQTKMAFVVCLYCNVLFELLAVEELLN
jgi:hypothetical protein